jgi:hypothetical protein
MANNQLPLTFDVVEDWNIKSADSFGIPQTEQDATNAAYKLADIESSTDYLTDAAIHSFGKGSIARKVAEGLGYEFDEGVLMQPDELNAEFGSVVDTPFDAPLYRVEAIHIYNRNKEKKQLREIVERGDVGMGTQLLAGIAASVTDPLDLAVGIVSGAAIGTAFKSLAGTRYALQAGRVSKILGFAEEVGPAPVTKTVGEVFRRGVTEGLAEGVVTEGVLRAGASSIQEQRSLQDSAFNMVVGAMAFPGIRLGINGMGSISTRGMQFMDKLDYKSAGTMWRSAINQMKEGSLPRDSQLLKHFVRETSDAKPVKGLTPILGVDDTQYVRVQRQDIPGKKFFISSDELVENINDLNSSSVVGDSYGGVVEASDNPYMKNAAVARSSSEATGHIYEVKVSKAFADNSIDLDMTINEMDVVSAAKFRKALKNILGDEEANMLIGDGNVAAKDLIETVHNGTVIEKYRVETINDFNEALKAEGVRGYIHNGSMVAGYDHQPHNSIVAFDKNDLEIVQSTPANREYTPKMSQENAKAVADEFEGKNTKIDSFVDDDKMDLEKTNIETIHNDPTTSLDSKLADYESKLDDMLRRGEVDQKFVDNFRKGTQVDMDLQESILKLAACEYGR